MTTPTSRSRNKDEMLAVAEACIAIARKEGANEASAGAYRSRAVELRWRDGDTEGVSESTTRGVGLQLFVDGRYSFASTSDLRLDALKAFIADSIALTRSLEKDPFRSLPDPSLYKDQAKLDLHLEDSKYGEVTPAARRIAAKEIEENARSVKGSESILSVTAHVSDELNEAFLVTSNGFSGHRRDTAFYLSGNVSVKDKDGRRPEDFAAASTRMLGDLPHAASIGREAAERALNRLGARKGESAEMTLVIDRRAGGRMVSMLLQALYAFNLQQKRSFFEGKVAQQVGSPMLTIADDPHVTKGLASRLFDDEGIASRSFSLFEAGVLRNYYIDTYYGRKLKLAPTTMSPSNLSWRTGEKDRASLIKEVRDGILVGGFLGGNSNSLTGDFSLGINGFRLRDGAIAEPVSETNISGNHLQFWKKLVAVGNDPYPYSSMRTPALVFEGVSVAGV